MSLARTLLRPGLLWLPLRPAPSTQQRWKSGVKGANLMGKPVRDMPKKPRSTSERRLTAERKRAPRPPKGLPPLPIGLTPTQILNRTEAYFIQRTPTRNLPIYHLTKSGGNLKQTRVRKVSGEQHVLLQELTETLDPKPEWIKVNPITKHIEMKGWYKDQIQKFLQAKGF